MTAIVGTLYKLFSYMPCLFLAGTFGALSLVVPAFALGPPARVSDELAYNSVGLITYQNTPVCSGTIIKHGVFLTAKHCFNDRPSSGSALLSWELNFPHSSLANHVSKFVSGGKIKGIVMEDKASDVAYILYDPAETNGIISTKQVEITLQIPNAGVAAQVVGFPVQKDVNAGTPRIISKDCQFTGVFKTIINYDGQVLGTNCRAFWGVSGGPVFISQPSSDQFNLLIGVVTHTFSTMPDGSVDPSKIKSDSFGSFVEDTNISPLTQASRLNEMMSLDLNSIPNAENAGVKPISQFCGYNSFAELMIEAKKAVGFLQEQTNFQPTFWIDGNLKFAQAALANMTTKNNDFLAGRSAEISVFPWAKNVFKSFDKFRKLNALKVFRENNVGQLVITDDMSECDAIECTSYFDFTVQINAIKASLLFNKFGDRAALHDLHGVVGHEYGHFILDNYYVTSHLYSSVSDSRKKVDPLKYHVTVDAIGMVLTSTTRKDFAGILRQVGSVEMMGQERLVGDIADRVRCIENLP